MISKKRSLGFRSCFTLIEVLIATLILALVGVGTLGLVVQSISLIRESRDMVYMTLVLEDLVTRDILGLLPEWEMSGERDGFKWLRETIPTQLPILVLHKYTVNYNGRSIDFVIVKRR